MEIDHFDMSDEETPESLLYRTPVKRPAPGKPPPGILMTPGINNTNKKKAVSFAASTSDEVKPRPQARIRSNLPNDLPGKFPSPWTPKTATPKGLDENGAAGLKKSLFEDNRNGEGNFDGKAVKKEREVDPVIQAKIDAHNEALRQTALFGSSHENGNTAAQDDADVTVNLDLPRSTSGKYWKERVEEVEAAYEKTLVKAQKWQEVCNSAKVYAKKKDAQCAEIAERLTEYMRENEQLLVDLNEAREMQGILLSRLGNGEGGGGRRGEERDNRETHYSSGSAGISARDVDDLRATIEAYEKKMVAMEELVEQREEEVNQLSMYIEESPDAPVDTVVRDLRKHLRKARSELREMTLVKVDNESKNLRLITLEKELSTYKSESARLEAELREARGGVGDTSHIASRNRSLHENRLRLQVERLEQDKINLMAELREKMSKESQERREMERNYKNQIREMDSRLDAAKLAAEKRDMEHDDLLRRMGEMEKQLTRKSKELDEALRQGEELRKNVSALAPVPGGAGTGESVMWQAKQRGLLSEVRAAKEEAADLRVRLDEKERECQGFREEVVKLRFRLHGMDVSRPGSPVKSYASGAGAKEKDNDVDMDMPVDRATTPPLHRRLSRTSLAASPARSNTFGGAMSSPSRQLQLDNAAGNSAASSRFLASRRSTGTLFSTSLKDGTRTNPSTPAKEAQRTTTTNLNHFATPVPQFSLPSNSKQGGDLAPLDTTLDMFNMPSSPPEMHNQAATTTTTPYKPSYENNFLSKPSPRPHIIPVSFSSSSPQDAHAHGNASAFSSKAHARRVTKRASVGGEAAGRKVSAAAAAARRISLPGGAADSSGVGVGGGSSVGMDNARKEAAKARLAEKRRARMAAGGGSGN